MQIEDIQKFLDNKAVAANDSVQISFRKRATITGIFVRGHRDYTEMKSKNFWRIVPESQFVAWEATGDVQLAKLFLGTEFSRLSMRKSS
ncbi:MAG: short-chain dehydrogenase [Chitinophagaceae bacterium]|nr:MAG: short-chain dehydrogenase [Chitinophagaceae bacterium]